MIVLTEQVRSLLYVTGVCLLICQWMVGKYFCFHLTVVVFVREVAV